MARLRMRSYYSGTKRKYRIEKLTLLGWDWVENCVGFPITFRTRQEAEIFIRKYNSIKKSVSRKIN